jgi:hypothetical protein
VWRVDRGAGERATEGMGRPRSLMSFVTYRCPSLMRSTSIAIASTACFKRSRRASDDARSRLLIRVPRMFS